MFNQFQKRLVNAAIIGLTTLSLSACWLDGDDGDNPVVAGADLTVPVAAAAAGAVVNTTYTFPAVADLGTTSATTLTFTTATATPGFTIASAEGTASGTTTFGSCIFTVSTSTFPSTAALGVGKTVTINPCNLVVQTGGVVAGSTDTSLGTVFVLGSIRSGAVTKAITVSANGTVSLGGITLGTVTVVEATGATGGGS